MEIDHLHNVLKIPYNPAIGQQIMVSGPNIPNVEHLMKDTRAKLMKGDQTQDVLPVGIAETVLTDASVCF